MVIYSSRGFQHSIAFKLLAYFLVSSSVLFGSLVAVFLILSGNFSSLAVEGSMRGIAADMEDAFYVDVNCDVFLDDTEIMLKWGFDALYSNLGYRLIHVDSGEEVIRSISDSVDGAIIDKISLNIPSGYKQHGDLPSSEGSVDTLRTIVTLAGKDYYFDVIRSDLLGKLANEAVLPAIIDISLSALGLAFFMFILVNIIAIKLIVKPVKKLSSQVAKIQPTDLTQRIDIEEVPNELIPITLALNDALSRVENGFNLQKRFVADAAHELRTPLTVLLSRIQLSLDESKVKEGLLGDTRYMSRIVEQLLDLSRAQNISEQEVRAMDVLSVIKDVVSMLAPLALETDHNLELVTQVDKSIIHADEGELSVVIKNLVENAIKHTPDGSDIIVTVEHDSFSIEDSGSGIPDSIKASIFERFWRANQSDMSGSGLGLAITKEILSHYGANIVVSRSTRLGGAKFKISYAAYT